MVDGMIGIVADGTGGGVMLGIVAVGAAVRGIPS